jgi:nitrogen fixation NifU-like protein
LTSDLRELYQELILEHGKRPRNFGVLDPCDSKALGYNPLCGDRLTVFVRYEDDKLQEIAFHGSGCAISQASASLMTESLKGRSPQDVARIFALFHDLVTGKSTSIEGLPPKLAAFAGVSEFPVRVKCATLPWHTLKAALDRAGEESPVTTE